jgi:uncharacterized membrane protein YeaQ/YmgE (transglycosylase-associated protein family)
VPSLATLGTVEGHHLITWVIIGLVAGSLASRLVGIRDLGCLATLAVGVAGAVIGGGIVGHLAPDTRYGFLGSIIVAFIGATLFLAVLRLLGVRRPERR